MIEKWIGVDLDGTLAHYEGWIGPEYIGAPIMPMLKRVKQWLREGKKVKIFTARVSDPENIPYIEQWLIKQRIGGLEITNVKDFGMTVLYDDRCVQVLQHHARHPPTRCQGNNTGKGCPTSAGDKTGIP